MERRNVVGGHEIKPYQIKLCNVWDLRLSRGNSQPVIASKRKEHTQKKNIEIKGDASHMYQSIPSTI